MASQQPSNAILMTEQEAERIRSTIKDRIKECANAAGSERSPRDAKGAVSLAKGASLMADMGGRTQDTLPVVAVGEPYPPCLRPLRDLEPMKLGELRMETHHRGKKLAVKRVAPVVSLAARSWTMVQDADSDETERLEVQVHRFQHGEELLELSKNFVLKEPYFTRTEDGEATLRIDHPSDLVTCDEFGVGDSDGGTARRLKDQGNAALKKQQFPDALANYTRGLEIATKEGVDDLTRDISRNRAYVNLLLGRLDQAITDAEASLIRKDTLRSNELDSKAKFRAACAAYNLGEYQQAKSLFEEQLKLTPTDNTATVYLKRIKRRLLEEAAGAYKWNTISAGLSRARPRADAASYFGNTKIGRSPGKGRGLFVTQDVSSGEIVLCEKAFCVVWGHEGGAQSAMTYDVRDDLIRVSPIGLTAAIVQKLLNNPSQIPKVMELYSDWTGADGKDVTATDDGPVVDVFRVHDLMSRNAFSPGAQYGEERTKNASTGLWLRAAFINHSCVANIRKEFVGDLMVIKANRAIKAGEELFQSYIESPRNYDARQKALMTTWGFNCGCALCQAQAGNNSR